MLGAAQLKAFIPVTHPDEAERFYRDVLGLPLLSRDDFALEFDSNQVPLRLAIVQKFTPQPFTVGGWNVKNISETIHKLIQKEVVFERYGFLQQDDLGIWTSPSGAKVAWFKDPDGNLLSLTEL